MKIKDVAESIWIDHKAEVIVSIVFVLAIIVLIYFTSPKPLVMADLIQIVTLMLLVVVTVSYAISTHRIHKATMDQVVATKEQAEVSRQAVQVALNAEKNAVMPILSVACEINGRGGGDSTQDVRAPHVNIGKGPALNLEIWLSPYLENIEDDPRSSSRFIQVLGIDDQRYCRWRDSREQELSLSTLSPGFCIVAEYFDVHGRKFRSKVLITDPLGSRSDRFSFSQVAEQGL